MISRFLGNNFLKLYIPSACVKEELSKNLTPLTPNEGIDTLLYVLISKSRFLLNSSEPAIGLFPSAKARAAEILLPVKAVAKSFDQLALVLVVLKILVAKLPKLYPSAVCEVE